jgi:hypothetical protein
MRLIAIVIAICVILLTGQPAPAGELVVDPATRAWAEKYGIEFQLDDLPQVPDGWKISPLSKTDQAALHVYLRLFREEFTKYPVPFVRATGLKRIILAKNMNVAGIERGAIPDLPHNAVWYDPFLGQFDDMYKRHVVHHEFFHFADNVLQGDVYLSDPYWASLNRPDFHYGGGGRTARTEDQFGVTNREPGFVNRYSTSGLEEDRAEIFASMWIPMESNILEQRSRSDAILRGKIHRMRAMMKYYATEPTDPKQVQVRRLFAALHGKERPSKALAPATQDPALLASRDWLGRTPLHWTILLAEPEQTRQLLDLGADPNAADDDGWTPLHIAAFAGDLPLVQSLKQAGADASLKDKRGGTPRDWAKLRGHADVEAALTSASRRSETRPR